LQGIEPSNDDVAKAQASGRRPTAAAASVGSNTLREVDLEAACAMAPAKIRAPRNEDADDGVYSPAVCVISQVAASVPQDLSTRPASVALDLDVPPRPLRCRLLHRAEEVSLPHLLRHPVTAVSARAAHPSLLIIRLYPYRCAHSRSTGIHSR